MSRKQLSKITDEQLVNSKEAINLPPRQRLELLLRANSYPIVKKRTSAEGQLKAMLDFYDFCCIVLAQFFQDKNAERNFIMLNFFETQEEFKSMISGEVVSAFEIMRNYEKIESKVCALQGLFYQYQYIFPELYYSYNLEEIATRHISDIIRDTKEWMKDKNLVNEVFKRWGLLE